MELGVVNEAHAVFPFRLLSAAAGISLASFLIFVLACSPNRT